MKTTIRRADLQDLDRVAPLFDAYRQFYGRSPDLEACQAFLKERLEKGESVVFLAEVDGAPAGFVQLYPSFTSVGIRRIWILNDLYVDASMRRHGVGRALMEAAANFARETGAARLELTTAKDNHTARALYVSMGYKMDVEFDRFELGL